jgi:hypothetical protein
MVEMLCHNWTDRTDECPRKFVDLYRTSILRLYLDYGVGLVTMSYLGLFILYD